MKLLVGADPEVFVKHKGDFVSAYNMVPGTKSKPHKVPLGAVQVDGMALEYNIEPAETSDQFVHHITTVLHTLRNMIPKDHVVDISAVAHFDEGYLKAQPREARELGCDPDLSPYTEMVNPSPDAHPSMRTAAGHVHIGWNETDMPVPFQQACMMAKQMDYALGLLGVLYDEDVQRQQMYGQPGAFRIKPYGIEYRVLSNFWIKDAKMAAKVYEHTCLGFWDLVHDGKNYEAMYGEAAKTAIENKDTATAQMLYEEMGWM